MAECSVFLCFLQTLISVKMLEKIGEFNMEKVIEDFEAMTSDAERIQKETLKKILEQNRSAEYLQLVGLGGRTDPESFKRFVPLVTHKDLEPYIQRIADGDSSPVLTGRPITTISLSSGTTQGRSKFVPFNDELMENTMQIYQTSFAFRNREFPIGNGKALQFIYGSKQFQTKGGLAAGTATTNVYRCSKFKETMKAMQTPCCSPDELVSSTFAHSIVQAFRTFELLWEELCADIRDGTLSSRITVPSIRAAMSKLLKPNPELADSVYRKCLGLSNWYGLIPALFPNAKYIYGVMTGSMEPYVNKLRHYAVDLPLLSADYGSSEGWIAANVNPKVPIEMTTYVVLPNIGYFEFIPIRDGSEFLPVGLTEVKIGEEYEVVVTNFAGLYRYRLGDVVKVMGFHNSTPELKFVCRSNLLLNINIDKNTEKDLQISVEEAAKLLAAEKLEVVDFSSHVDLSTDPGHYVIFWELSGEASQEVLSECCNCLDKSFVDAGYMSSRKVNGIGPLELRILRKGTFQKMLHHFLAQGSAVNQFKTPRCVGVNNSKESIHDETLYSISKGGDKYQNQASTSASPLVHYLSLDFVSSHHNLFN
ncbi:hypothetical protein ACLB2K_074331 [Fragaria x ananassa]